MMQRYAVTIKAESGISSAMRKYCDDCGISVWKFLSSVVEERLRNPLDFSIAEIEDMQSNKREKNAEFEQYMFGISDTIMQEKLRIIKEDYNIPLSRFFVRVIAEKLEREGYSFDDKSIRNPVRKSAVKQNKKSNAEKMRNSTEELRNFMINLDMRKK